MAQPEIAFDNASQLARIQAYVIPGEKLVSVFDCKGGGTGFVGITDRRLIFYDQAFVTGKKAMVSIPYNQVIGVGSADEGIVFQTSEITLLTAAGNYTFIFRGADKAHWAYSYIIAQLVNQASPQLPG
jgi:hypothetical protein